YSNTSGKLIDDVVFQDNGIVDHRTYYNDEGIKTRTLSHYKNSNSVEWETFYKEDGFKEKANRYSNGTNKLIDEIVYQEQNKVDVRTYFSEEGKKILVVRYKINGIDMKWITKYKNGEKIAYAYPSEKKFDIDRIKNSDISTLNVKQIDIDENLSDNTFYYYSKEELNNDLLIDELKNEKKDTTIYSLFEDSTLSDYISQLTELDASREIFGEDLMKIKKININIHDDESFSFLENINGINLLINIEEITINNTNLEKISGNISLLPKLRILNLSNNKIDDIGENLSNLRKLEYIDLSNNLIIGIHDEFDNLINLNYLGLNNMDIKFLSNSLIDMHDHYSLKKIDLTENIVSLEYMDLIRINDFIDNNILFDGEKPFKKLFDNREIFIFNDDKDFNSMIDLTLLTKFFDSKKDIKYNLNLKLYYINDSLNDDININNITSFKDELINSDAISNEFTINDNLLSNKGTYIVLLEISTDKYKAVSSRIIRKYDITSTVYYSTLINDNSDEYNVKDNNLNFKIVGESDNNVKNKGEIEFDCRRNYVYKGIKKRNAKAEKIHPSFPVPIKTNRFWVYSSKQISVSGAIGVGYKFVNASFTISGGSGGGAWEISSNKNKKARPVVVTYGNLQAYAHRYGHCPMKYVLTHGWETGYAKYYK
ncbi:MAG: leucine-rich repeat domain-containing protein, partial [Bacilli bacterium]|nr:leucine-rich repeat domain-containing protein [Bacilli bacterium]